MVAAAIRIDAERVTCCKKGLLRPNGMGAQLPPDLRAAKGLLAQVIVGPG